MGVDYQAEEWQKVKFFLLITTQYTFTTRVLDLAELNMLFIVWRHLSH